MEDKKKKEKKEEKTKIEKWKESKAKQEKKEKKEKEETKKKEKKKEEQTKEEKEKDEKREEKMMEKKDGKRDEKQEKMEVEENVEEGEKMEEGETMEDKEYMEAAEKLQKLLYNQKHRKQVPVEVLQKMQMIPRRIAQSLALYTAACFDVNRHVVLAMKQIPVRMTRPMEADPNTMMEFALLFCIKFIENNVVYPLAAVQFDKKSPQYLHHLSKSMRVIIEDLHLIGLHIVMTISLPEPLYKEILRDITKDPTLCTEPEAIVYTVDGNEIVHVYDLYGLQVNFQDVFQTHKELYYLAYRNDLVLLKSYWEDIELAMAALGGDCSFGLDKRAPRTCIFVMSFYYAFLKAYESGVVGVGERDSYDATRYLLRLFCPAAQVFLSFTSVTPEQLEDLFDQFEDFRLALASAFFKMHEWDTRTEDAIPNLQTLRTRVEFTNLTLDTFAEHFHNAHKIFVRRLGYRYTRMPSKDAGDKMRRKMDRWSFIYMEKVSQEFERLFKELAKTVAEHMHEKKKTRTLPERPLTALDQLITKFLPKREKPESESSPRKKSEETDLPKSSTSQTNITESSWGVATDEITLSSLPEDTRHTDVAESPSITINEVSWSRSSSAFTHVETCVQHSMHSDIMRAVGIPDSSVADEQNPRTPSPWYFFPIPTTNVSQPATFADFQNIFSDPRVYYYPEEARSEPTKSKMEGLDIGKPLYKTEHQPLVRHALKKHDAIKEQPIGLAGTEEDVDVKKIEPVLSSRDIEWDLMRRSLKRIQDETNIEEVLIICKEITNDQDIVISREVIEASTSDYDLIRFDPQPGHPPPEPIIDKERKSLAKRVVKQIRTIVRRFEAVIKNEPDLAEKPPKRKKGNKEEKQHREKKKEEEKEKKGEKEKGMTRFKKWISGRKKDPEREPIEIGNPPISLELRPKPPLPPRTNIQMIWLPKKLIKDFGGKLTYEQFLKLKRYKDREERHRKKDEKMDVDSAVADPTLAVGICCSSSSSSSSDAEAAEKTLAQISRMFVSPFATSSNSSAKRTIPNSKLPPTQIAKIELIIPDPEDYVSSEDEISLPSPPIQIDDYAEDDEGEPSRALTPPVAFEILTTPTPIPDTPSSLSNLSSSSERLKQAKPALAPLLETETKIEVSTQTTSNEEFKWKQQGAKPKGWKPPLKRVGPTLVTATTRARTDPVPATSARVAETEVVQPSTVKDAEAEPAPSTSATGAGAEPSRSTSAAGPASSSASVEPTSSTSSAERVSSTLSSESSSTSAIGTLTESAPSTSARDAGEEPAPSKSETGAGAEPAPSTPARGAGTELAPSKSATDAGAEATPSKPEKGLAANPAPSKSSTGARAQPSPSTSSAEPESSTSTKLAKTRPAFRNEARLHEGPRLKKREPGDEEQEIRYTVPGPPPNPDLLLLELRNRRVVYRHKLMFAVLMSYLPADVQLTDASIDWLSTLKGMLRIAHTMRMRGVNLVFTNCFSIEWVDFFINKFRLQNRMPFQEVVTYWSYDVMEETLWYQLFTVRT